jgi:hypothetical protein
MPGETKRVITHKNGWYTWNVDEKVKLSSFTFHTPISLSWSLERLKARGQLQASHDIFYRSVIWRTLFL